MTGRVARWRCSVISVSFHTRIVPTKYRRIAVTEDPSLASALKAASKVRPGLSNAALLKELAIIGAGVVAGQSDRNPSLERILAMPGARLPTRKFSQVLADIDAIEKISSREVDQILEEDRAERL